MLPFLRKRTAVIYPMCYHAEAARAASDDSISSATARSASARIFSLDLWGWVRGWLASAKLTHRHTHSLSLALLLGGVGAALQCRCAPLDALVHLRLTRRAG